MHCHHTLNPARGHRATRIMEHVLSGSFASPQLKAAVDALNQAHNDLAIAKAAFSDECNSEIRRKVEALLEYNKDNEKVIGLNAFYVFQDNLYNILALTEGRTDYEI